MNGYDNLKLYASEIASHTMKMYRTFELLCDEHINYFPNSNFILILDCFFAEMAIRGFDSRHRDVGIVASVGYDQSALGNPSNQARIQNRTFTSRLADEVAKRIRCEDGSISFAKVVDELRRQSNRDRLSRYCLPVGGVGVRIPKPTDKTRIPSNLRTFAPSESASMHHQPLPPAVTAIFKVHLDNTDLDSPEVLKLVQWVHCLDLNIGLQLSGAYKPRPTEMALTAPWYLRAQFSQRQGFSLVCETFGSNKLPEMLSCLSH